MTGQLEAGVLTRHGAHRRADQPAVTRNAVVDVDHQITRLQLGDKRLARRGDLLGDHSTGGRRSALLGPAENLTVRKQRQAEGVGDPALAQQPVHQLYPGWWAAHRLARRGVDTLLVQQLAEPTRLLTHHDGGVRTFTFHDVPEERVQPAAVLGRVGKRQALGVGIEPDLDPVGVHSPRALAPRPVRPRQARRHFAALEQIRVQLLYLLLELLGKAADRFGLVEDQESIRRQIVGKRRAAQKASVELERREGMLTLAQQPQVARERIQELRAQRVEVEADAEGSRQHLVSRSHGCRFELLG